MITTSRLQSRLQSLRSGWVAEASEGVQLAKVPLHRNLDGGAVEVGLIGNAIKGCDAGNVTVSLDSGREAQSTSHAESCDSAGFAALAPEKLRSSFYLLHRAGE